MSPSTPAATSAHRISDLIGEAAPSWSTSRVLFFSTLLVEDQQLPCRSEVLTPESDEVDARARAISIRVAPIPGGFPGSALDMAVEELGYLSPRGVVDRQSRRSRMRHRELDRNRRARRRKPDRCD